MPYIIRMDDTKPFDSYIFPTAVRGSLNNHFGMTDNVTANAIYSQELLDKAYKEAYEVGEKAGHESGFVEGEKEGYAAGLIKGTEQGRQEGKQELNITLCSLNSAILQSHELFLSMREDIKKAALSMITEIAQKVVNNELALNPNIMLQWIEDSIASLPAEPTKITISFHEDDYQRIVELGEFIESHWKLKSNSSIKLGCCEINTNMGDITISPHDKIQTMIEQVE